MLAYCDVPSSVTSSLACACVLDEGPSEYQTIPLSKIEDFGVHAKQYYSLDISFFKSGLDAHMLDLLWNKVVWGLRV